MKNDDTFRYKAAFILFAAAYFLVSVTAKITADRERPVNVEVVTVESAAEQTTKQTEQDIVRELPNETSVFIDLTADDVDITDVPERVLPTAEETPLPETSAETTQGNTVTTVVTTSKRPAKTETTAFVGIVNINTASREELMALKGVGEKTADAIIAYREIAPFETPEEIMEVKGIGEKKYEAIKDHICV
jgi:competence protein ComEA